MKLIFNHPGCTINYNKKLKVIQVKWSQTPVENKTLQTILNWMIAGMDVYNCSTIIADTRQMNMVWKEGRKWIVENWYPRAVKAGFRQQALIVSEESAM